MERSSVVLAISSKCHTANDPKLTYAQRRQSHGPFDHDITTLMVIVAQKLKRHRIPTP